MPLIPSNFASNSLTGTVRVSGGYANIVLPVTKYAFEDRTKTFTLKLRRDSIAGPVIAQSNTVTLTDFSEIISLTANIGTVAEGNLVSFTLVTANVVDGANVFFSVLPMTANVNTEDFVGANTGVITINSNQGVFTLAANADNSLVNEAGETFKVQIRTNNTSGNVVFTSSNVIISDVSKRTNVYSFVASSSSIVEGSSVTFTIFAHNLPVGNLLYYYTTGNTDIFAGSNTGSITFNSESNTVTISTSPTVPANQTRSFNLVLSESSLGTPVATSNTIAVVDSAVAYMNATGGTVTIGNGFKLHTFTTSNTFTISNFTTAVYNTANILVVAGGGSGGGGLPMPYGPSIGSGGGGGGFVQGTAVPFSAAGSYSVTVGSGAAVNPSGGSGIQGSNSSITAGSNFSNVIAVGGGGGGTPFYSGSFPGGNGGSGGGGYTAGGGFGFPSPTQQGFPGGSALAHPQGVAWQAGGGAGGVGLEGSPPGVGVPPAALPSYAPYYRTARGGPGANSNITGSNVLYAGGGGGGSPGAPGNPVTFDAGPGGGGYSGMHFAVFPAPVGGMSGNVNTGGGGGAAAGGPSPTSTVAGAGGSGIVIIRYPWVPPAVFSNVTANSSALYEGANAFFVVNTAFANAQILYYDTLGNVTNSSFVGGNTGSFTVTGNATVLRLETVANVPTNETRTFALRIREDSTTGNIVLTSSNVIIYDSNIFIYINATGGNVFTSGGYRTHIFTSSNNFVVTDAGVLGGNIEYFMVGGGGGGGISGNDGGAGGGAGGVLFGSSTVVANTYTVTVGGGGSGYSGDTDSSTSYNGANSSIVGATIIGPGIDAVGGGGGGTARTAPQNVGKKGGSGGGSITTPSSSSPIAGGSGYGFPGIIGSTMQGYPGGSTLAPAQSKGGPGGGGAGGAADGITSPSMPAQGGTPGGIGISSPLSPTIPGFFGAGGPTPGRWFAGGGGGAGGPAPSGGYGIPTDGRLGGAGGGGRGANSPSPTTATAGNVNTGGGGGGGTSSGTTTPPGSTAGGSGIVIIRYPYA